MALIYYNSSTSQYQIFRLYLFIQYVITINQHAVAPSIRYNFSLNDMGRAKFIQLKFKGINNCSFWLDQVSLRSIHIVGTF